MLYSVYEVLTDRVVRHNPGPWGNLTVHGVFRLQRGPDGKEAYDTRAEAETELGRAAAETGRNFRVLPVIPLGGGGYLHF